MNKHLPGLVLALLLALAAAWLAGLPALASRGISPLVLAIVAGMLLGNLAGDRLPASLAPGLGLSQRVLLRVGVALFGLHISFAQIAELGWSVVLLDAVVVVGVMLAGTWAGQRWLGLDREMAILTSIGSAVCGAAAVLAAAPVLRADNQRVAMAVATVVLFGTLAMFVYPLLYPLLGMSPGAYGIYVGSTVHEVAQVVAAGMAIDQAAAESGVIVKLVRVMMLAPLLLLISAWLQRGETDRPVYIPWFVLAFIAISAVNTWLPLPPTLHALLLKLDLLLLAMAMAALGINTRISVMRRLGAGPLRLAAVLFVLLLAGGYGLNLLMVSGA